MGVHGGSLTDLVYRTLCGRYSFVEGMCFAWPKRRFGLHIQGARGGLSQAQDAYVTTVESSLLCPKAFARHGDTAGRTHGLYT